MTTTQFDINLGGFQLISFCLQDRKLFEKLGEPTEVALKVLAEKLNLAKLDQGSMTGKQLACSNYKQALQEYSKLFTLEFSRDRKSMSVYCKPKAGDGKPVMFVKVRAVVVPCTVN